MERQLKSFNTRFQNKKSSIRTQGHPEYEHINEGQLKYVTITTKWIRL